MSSHFGIQNNFSLFYSHPKHEVRVKVYFTLWRKLQNVTWILIFCPSQGLRNGDHDHNQWGGKKKSNFPRGHWSRVWNSLLQKDGRKGKKKLSGLTWKARGDWRRVSYIKCVCCQARLSNNFGKLSLLARCFNLEGPMILRYEGISLGMQAATPKGVKWSKVKS